MNLPQQSSSAQFINHAPLQQPINLNVQSGSRILISGLPADVTAPQLHELFDQTVSPVNRVDVFCDSAGISKGVALIEFHSIEAALRSHEQFHGKLIDKVSTITVEIMVVPAIPALAPPQPPAPTMTTTITPGNQQPPNQPAIPVAPRSKKPAKQNPPPSKLTLKQRLALPTPTAPRRFLFDNSAPPSGIKTIKQRKKKYVSTDPASHAKKPRNSKSTGFT